LVVRKHEGEELNTVYLGGGTPSVLEGEHLTQVFRFIRDHYSIKDKAEITIEVNPDDVSRQRLEQYKSLGINRISLGIQSFRAEDLQYMGRIHSVDDGRRALELIQNFGFENISIDLIFGLPTLDLDSWKENVKEAIRWNVPHLSCYQLTIEAKTPLEALIRRQLKAAPDEAQQATQFKHLIAALEGVGFEHYEISNFAKPGFRSQHNSSYWTGESYIGIGPSAHSFDGQNRQWNVAHNIRYMDAVEAGNLPYEAETLTPYEQYNEFVLTRLRMQEGVSSTTLAEKHPGMLEFFTSQILEYVDKGWVRETKRHYQLTPSGKLWADHIASDLMMVG
jgi:oxygen-independent coproporphyrinogen-3 oxidase